MRSDLTCPVEVVKVHVRREEREVVEEPRKQLVDGEVVVEEGEPRKRIEEQIVCDIEFQNLSDKETASIQMNIICFDADNQRLGGRLVRSAAASEPKGRFSGQFMPEHVDGTARVEASVEKVWYKDGVVWRREERNVREYTPNQLPEGRELDRLRAVAGPDAAGYAREDDTVWMCVCGRANRTSEDRCMRCERERTQVLKDYCFSAIDSTVGQKERTLEQQSKVSLRKSSEQTVRSMTRQKKEEKKRVRRVKRVIALLVFVVLALAGLRWGLPYGANLYAQRQLDMGLAADAKTVFDWVNLYWPGFGGADGRAQQAEQVIIEGLISAGTDETLEGAARRALLLETADAAALHEKAVIVRAELAWKAGDTDKAETLLRGLTTSEKASTMLSELIYEAADHAQETLDYPTAIARFEELGGYEDAAARKDECIYLYGRQLMREGQYVQATEQFMQVTGEPDAIALIRQCRYAIALEAQENGDYMSAAKAYESLGIYEEAETRAKLCRYTAGMNALESGALEIAAEQLKLAGDYEDAQARFVDAAYTLGAQALAQEKYTEAIGWLEQLPHEGEAADALNEAIYAYAQQLEATGVREEAIIQYGLLGEYEDAAERANALLYAIALEEMEESAESALSRFEALGSYQDAQEKAQACRYQLAQERYEAGEYEYALALFEELGAYGDAQTQVRRSRYALAGVLYDNAQYAEAAELYKACGAYLHAEERAMRASYEAAAVLESKGNYREAADAFAALGSYEDAKLRVITNEDGWLRKIYHNAWLDMDLGDYDSVIEALDPLQGVELPERYQELETMYSDACLKRSEELIDAGRPLDALPVLERIPQSKTAQKRLDAYVYRIIGRWKDTKGREFTFRRDGTCRIDGKELYFGGSSYYVFVGETPYPTKLVYNVVSLKRDVLTLRDEETDKNFRLTYLGEPEPAQQAGTSDADSSN